MESSVQQKIQELGDLDLAALLCLVGEQHCIVTTEDTLVEEVADELASVFDTTLNLQCIVLDCSGDITLDEFRESVLVDAVDPQDAHEEDLYSSRRHSQASHAFRSSYAPEVTSQLDERRVANVIIAKNLNSANHHIQTQALELIRTKRLYSRTAMHAASKAFLFVAVHSANPSQRLPHHLNELFCISHHHSASDAEARPNYDESKRPSFDSTASFTSVIRHHRPSARTYPNPPHAPAISASDLDALRASVAHVRVSAEVAVYTQNIVVFMRLSRYVNGGVTAPATRQLKALVKALAVVHGLDYVSPSLVDLAVRKVYAHRLVLATAETERSLQWGSDPGVVKRALRGFTVERAIEEVLASVETPL